MRLVINIQGCFLLTSIEWLVNKSLIKSKKAKHTLSLLNRYSIVGYRIYAWRKLKAMRLFAPSTLRMRALTSCPLATTLRGCKKLPSASSDT